MHDIRRYTKHKHSKQNHWHAVTAAHTNIYIQPEGGGSEGGAAQMIPNVRILHNTHTHVLLTQTETVHSWLWSMLQSLSYLPSFIFLSSPTQRDEREILFLKMCLFRIQHTIKVIFREILGKPRHSEDVQFHTSSPVFFWGQCALGQLLREQELNIWFGIHHSGLRSPT